jgi:hypothetical protein
MTIMRWLGLGLLAAGVSVGSAASASATYPLEGTYTVVWSGGDITTWTFAPCGSGCTHLSSSMGWSGDARFSDGFWTLERNDPQVATCPDNTPVPGTRTYRIYPDNLVGEMRTFRGTDCGDSSRILRQSFSLTRP